MKPLQGKYSVLEEITLTVKVSNRHGEKYFELLVFTSINDLLNV